MTDDTQQGRESSDRLSRQKDTAAPASPQESIPQKSINAFRTISEVATELGVPQHVLRFWESKFSQISPMKRGGGRRYYRPADVDMIAAIRKLLYEDGYTIKGAQKHIRECGLTPVVAEQGDDKAGTPPVGNAYAHDIQAVTDKILHAQAEDRESLNALKDLRRRLQDMRQSLAQLLPNQKN